MKKLPAVLFLLLAAATINFAQTLIIKPKKTVYTRKGKDVSKEKKTFIVTYPLFNGALTPTAKRNLENTISYWRVFEMTLEENLGDYHWLSELSYEVNYNKNGVLNIALTEEGIGAYPDGATRNLVIDLKTGKQVKFADVFKAESLDRFAQMVNAKLKTEVEEIVKSIEEDKSSGNPEENEADKKQLRDLNFTAQTFDEFSLNDKGVTIFYDAGFPHVIRALEPTGSYFFTWAEVKPFIKPDNLLGKFVR